MSNPSEEPEEINFEGDILPIYEGEFVPDLAVCVSGKHKGWLMSKHPDGNLVLLCNLNDFGIKVPFLKQEYPY